MVNNARAREENFISQLKNEQGWIEVMAKNYGYAIDDIPTLLDKFNTDCECRGTTHRNLSDARQHFNNWLAVKQSKEAAAPDKRKRASKNVNELWR